jgi:small conductance mechanosensitive channel
LVVILVLQFLLGVLVLRMLHRFVGTLIHQSQRLRQRHATPEDIERAATIVRGGAQIFFALLAISLILELWGVSVTWLLTAPLTTQIVRRLVLIGLAVGLLVGIIQASNALTEYLIQPRRSATGDAPQEVSRQLRTLAPLIQTVIRVGAIFIGGLVILEQLGIDAAPILAGLGLFGLAVGLASQSLIKDVINGLFLLFEDSLSVGDVVSLRGTGGQVEKVTLRAVTIRDLAGNVHIIPNSTIDMVTNMTKVYSRYVLDVGVAYREDVDAVINILREIDTEMRRDPLYRRDMLEPLEVLGLERFDESAVVIRARLKTRPIQQWRIGREFNRRLKKVFDERGIEIPFPHRTLYWGNPPSGSQPPLPVAVEEISPRSTGAPGNGRDTRSPKTPEEPPA